MIINLSLLERLVANRRHCGFAHSQMTDDQDFLGIVSQPVSGWHWELKWPCLAESRHQESYQPARNSFFFQSNQTTAEFVPLATCWRASRKASLQASWFDFYSKRLTVIEHAAGMVLLLNVQRVKKSTKLILTRSVPILHRSLRTKSDPSNPLRNRNEVTPIWGTYNSVGRYIAWMVDHRLLGYVYELVPGGIGYYDD